MATAVPADSQVKFFDGSQRGYARCSLTRDAWRSDYRTLPSASDNKNPATTLTFWAVENGRPGAQSA